MPRPLRWPLLAAVGASLVAPAAASAHQAPRLSAAPARAAGPPASAAVLRHLPLPLDAHALARAKAAAERRIDHGSAVSPLQVLAAPTSLRNWTGIQNSNSTPPDTTGSIGTTRYIETINTNFAIYNRTSNTPLSTGTLAALDNDAAGNFYTDPQVMWDATTSRFYYANLDIPSSNHVQIAVGFSRTASPTTAADFCHYFIDYGTTLPDFPKLGDTARAVFIGSNDFASFSNTAPFVGTEIFGLSKPANGAITTCPAGTTFKTADRFFDPTTAPGSNLFTPVPSNQVDGSTAGWAVFRDAHNTTTKLWLDKLSTDSTGTPVIAATPQSVTVASYAIPPGAPSPGVTQKIDTSDARPTQAVLAIDPARGATTFALWVQHTVAGGAGSVVRWYEVNPATRTLFQSGTVAPTGLFAFNAAISPDRQVNGATKRFGSNMVLHFDTSSSTSNPAIRAVSKIGAGAVSAPLLIKSSTAGYRDFACTAAGSTCRWGDYAGASPDPATPSGATVGQVWGTNEWNTTFSGTNDDPWRTQNFAVHP